LIKIDYSLTIGNENSKKNLQPQKILLSYIRHQTGHSKLPMSKPARYKRLELAGQNPDELTSTLQAGIMVAFSRGDKCPSLYLSFSEAEHKLAPILHILLKYPP
jgi:hypothetical protein